MNCLVTGASRGIGKAVALKLAANGYGVTLCARNRDLLESTRLELPVVSESQLHDVWTLDMADLHQLTSQAPPRPLGEYSHFVNCAGIAEPGLVLTQSAKSIDRVLTVNLHAPILLAKQVARAMMRQKQPHHKHIVFMSSILAQKGVLGSAIYSASKAGLEGFTRSFAREVGKRHISVNCIAPGLVNTDMGTSADQGLMATNVFPGLIQPEAVADLVAFLLTSENITGQSLVIDNGGSI